MQLPARRIQLSMIKPEVAFIIFRKLILNLKTPALNHLMDFETIRLGPQAEWADKPKA